MDDKLISLAKWVLRLRATRTHYFDAKLFDEDSWDLLLNLFIAAGEGRTMGRDEVIRHGITSANTLDRWIKILADEQLLTEDGGADGTLALTPNGRTRMHDLLAEMFR